jgi:hypothetical protein
MKNIELNKKFINKEIQKIKLNDLDIGKIYN